VIYRDWWLKRGIRIFGYPYDKPRVQQIAVLPNGSEADVATISQLLETSYAERRRAEGLTASLIVSLPLTSKPDEVVRRVKQLLKQHKQQDLGPGQPPAIQIMGRRVLVSAYSKGLRLLWFRAAKPNWELWRLGTLAQLSDSYSKALDHRAPRKCRDSIEAQDRSIMTKITQRLLTRFELIAENAARGKFPCAEPVEMVPQNYPALAKRLKAYSDWKKEYEAKWREQNQSAAP
jgi:hypothetical protein